MSSVNYFTSLTDHSQVLISVKCAANINSNSVQYVLQHLESHRTVPINDAGCSINVKYSLDEALENSAWGSLQAHRQVCGLIYLAEATNAMESALTLDKFTKLKEQYGSGLYQSRCIIFGIDTAIRPTHSSVFQFSSHEAWKSIDHDIKEVIASIYYMLESKRQNLLQQTKPLLLRAPYETPEEMISETDSKLLRRKCSGRHNKHLGDIQLILGLVPESLQSYNTALDMLVSAGDLVWVGSALEGLCVVSAMILLGDIGPRKGLFSKKDAQSAYALDPRNLKTKQTSGLNFSDVKKFCIPSFKELVDKYREAIINYSKVRDVAVIELEACIKATKIFTRAKNFLEASEFIQNAVYISLKVDGPERLMRYSIMGELYKDIKFKRKSFFYKRVAAMQCVNPESPDWKRCNDLLMEAMSNLSSGSKDFPNSSKGIGWPSVVQRVWRELIFAIERNGDRALSARHLLHVFLSMFSFMSEAEEKDIHASLETFAKNGRDIDTEPPKFPYKLDFYKCPIIKAVLPQTDIDGFRPIKSENEASPKSVFIYTPTPYKAKEQNEQSIYFDWCVNTPCRIDVEIYNPLSYCPVQINEFRFVLDSNDESSLESVIFSFSVPPQVTSKITVSITPTKPGLLKIIGYKYRIFGIEAKCFFTENKDIKTSEITVNVISELPLLRSDFTGAQPDYHENDIPEIVAYVGETLTVPFKLTNIGSSLVTRWDVTCKTNMSNDQASVIYDKNFTDIQLPSGTSISLPVKIKPKLECKDPAIPCSCKLIIKYAATLEGDEWWRSLEVDMNLIFRMSMEVTDVTIVTPRNFSCPTCNIKVAITNHLKEHAELQWDEYIEEKISKNSVKVPGNCIYSCDISLKKLKLPDSLDDSYNLCGALFRHIQSMLNLTWKLQRGRHRHHYGDASFNFTLQKQDYSKIVDVPIVCSLTSNGTVLDETQENSVLLSEVSHFAFNFYNTSVSKQAFKVTLEIYQDQMNGFIERNLDECLICLGCTTGTLELGPGDSEEFPCDILILKEGTFCVRAVYAINFWDKLSAVSSTMQYFSPPITIKTTS